MSILITEVKLVSGKHAGQISKEVFRNMDEVYRDVKRLLEHQVISMNSRVRVREKAQGLVVDEMMFVAGDIQD